MQAHPLKDVVTATIIALFGMCTPRYTYAQQPQTAASTPANASAYRWEGTYDINFMPGGASAQIKKGDEVIGSVVRRGNELTLTPASPNANEVKKLQESFARFKLAYANGTAHASAPAPAPAISVPDRGAKPVTFGADGSAQILLNDGTTVEFSRSSIEVTQRPTTPGLPANSIKFNLKIKGGLIGQAYGGTGITMNGQPLNWQRKGPQYDRLKAGLLQPTLQKAAEAADIASRAADRPVNALDYEDMVKRVRKNVI